MMIEMTTSRQHMQQALALDQLTVTVSSGLGVFGFLPTAAGLLGVIQYAVNRRTREIGLQMALGRAIRRAEQDGAFGVSPHAGL
jgi:hypothetical protein